MKKLIALLLMFVLVFSLCACSSNDTDATKPNTEITSTADGVHEQDDSNYSDGDIVVEFFGDNTYKVPLKNIYIDAPNWQEIEEGYTEVFIVHESKYVAITSDRKATATDSKNAHEVAFDKFKTNMQNYEGGVNGISVEKEKSEKINGIDTYWFEGKINYGKTNVYDGYAVGYAFVMDGVPCEIIGSVIDESQSAVLIKEIRETVSGMMASVRDKA